MTLKLGIAVVVGIIAIGSLSSFADTADLYSSNSKKKELSDKSDSSEEPNENTKESRSQEHIMFGNQQGHSHAHDVMDISEHQDSDSESSDNSYHTDDSVHENGTQKSEADDAKSEDDLNADAKMNSKRNLPLNTNSDGNLEMGPAMAADWYNNAAVSQDTLQYLLNTAPLRDVNGLYDQEELYRRKRQLRPMTLRKRSLRSPLGQMIQSRGRRLPRRSMRFKRQVVQAQDILSLLNNAESVKPRKFFDETDPNSNFNNYQYSEAPTFRRPYDFLQHDKNDDDDDVNNWMDNLNNYDPEEVQLQYGGPTVNEEEEIEDHHPKWMEREYPEPTEGRSLPKIFTLSRRSTTPLFYPVDYRYVPGYKKRSSFSGRGRNDDTEFGKWGRVVNVPEAYASAGDVANLYDLANLLAGNENPEIRTRRSA